MSLIRFDLLSDVSPDSRSRAQMLYISTAKSSADWLSVPHTHDCAELFYITGGQGSFKIGGKVVPTKKDDLIIISPQVEHTEISDWGQPLEYIVVGLSGLELATGEGDEQQFYIRHMQFDNVPVQIYLRDMLHEIETRASGCEAVCQNLLGILLIKLARSSKDAVNLIPSASHKRKESATVRRYIDGHFKEPITLELLANLVHINKFHMAHNFTRDYGISPINYLLSLRLRESRLLLQSTNYSMAQIARIVGFSSSCYFSQVFKKASGISPSEYRARIISQKGNES